MQGPLIARPRALARVRQALAANPVRALLGPRQCDREAYFWGTHAGAEIDLVLFRHGRRIGVEFKCGDAPAMTRSLHVALHDLALDPAFVVYPGRERYRLHEKVEVAPLMEVPRLLVHRRGA